MTAIYDPIDHADDPAVETPAELLCHLRDRRGIDPDEALELWWSGPPAIDTRVSDLETVAQHSSDLCMLSDLLREVCATIERGAWIARDQLTALRRAYAGLPSDFSELPDEPLTRELVATANVARALTGRIESGHPVPRYAAAVIGELVQLAEHP